MHPAAREHSECKVDVQVKPVAKGVNEDTASSSQVWHQNKNTRSGIVKPVSKMINRLGETRLTHHNFQILSVDHLEKVFSNVRQSLSRPQGEEMQDIASMGSSGESSCQQP